MIGIIAQKSGMTRLVLDSGDVVGVTWFKIEPNVVTQIKTLAKEGYAAVQLGTGKPKRLTKPLQGHLKNLEARVIKEIKINPALQTYQYGDVLDASVFQVGDKVNVTAVSKGKGFAGTIKRHNFSSGPGGHGHDHHRQPGSIGAMGMPRVEPGRRMSGHMGAKQITTKSLKVVAVDLSKQMIAVAGSVPGYNKSFTLIKKYA